MANVDPDGETVRLVVAVAPTAVALTVAAPAPVPATVAVNWPLLFVVPDGGVNVTLPAPELVSVTAVPDTGFPPASLAVIVSAAGDVPLSGSELELALTVTVEPTICIGI